MLLYAEHLKRIGFGLLFGMHYKHELPNLHALHWICKWPEKAPISSVLQQQEHCCTCSRLLEIPTRHWSLRMSFMQRKSTELQLSFCCTGCFVKGLLNQIDTIVYALSPCIHMYGVTDLINYFIASEKITICHLKHTHRHAHTQGKNRYTQTLYYIQLQWNSWPIFIFVSLECIWKSVSTYSRWMSKSQQIILI